MADIDQFELQTKYVRYLSTQQRVSDWVRGSGSQSRPRLGRKPSGPRHITKSSRAPTHSSDSSTKDAELAISTTARQQQIRIVESELQMISPTVALISSALLICVILPSLLTVSVFAVLLTYAGSLGHQEPQTESTAELHASISQTSL